MHFPRNFRYVIRPLFPWIVLLLYSLVDPYVNFLAQVCSASVEGLKGGGEGKVWIPGALNPFGTLSVVLDYAFKWLYW